MHTNAEPAVLALDGGSSKTDAVLVAEDGTLLGRARVGPSNHQLVGLDAAMDALGEAIAAATADAGIDDPPFPLCPMGVYCLAGIDLPGGRGAPGVPPSRCGAGRESTCCTTTPWPYRGRAPPSAWGIGVVCGSGLNCAGVGPDGTTVRFPALAELSGDFAPGGSWLGVRALGLALRASDGRGPPTLLSSLVPAHFDHADAEAVLTAVYTGALPYGRLFELARVLLDAAAEGDLASRQAADVLADEVATFAGAAITRLGVARHRRRGGAGRRHLRHPRRRVPCPCRGGRSRRGTPGPVVAAGRAPGAGRGAPGARRHRRRRARQGSPPGRPRSGVNRAGGATGAGRRLCRLRGPASSSIRSSSASSELARCLTMSITSGCSWGFQPSSNSVSPLRRASAGGRWRPDRSASRPGRVRSHDGSRTPCRPRPNPARPGG